MRSLKAAQKKTRREFYQEARAVLLAGLEQCTEAQQHLFKRAYSPDNLDLPIEAVVKNMPNGKLERAVQQVERTLELIADQAMAEVEEDVGMVGAQLLRVRFKTTADDYRPVN